MFRHSLMSSATVGSLCLLLAAACEQKTESTPPATTTTPSPTAAPGTTTAPGTGTATGTGGGAAMGAERDDTVPVSGTDEPMGAGKGGTGGHGGGSTH